MELEILKKKISSYRTEGGHLTKVSDELMVEILLAWEQWTGPAKGFYSAIGVNQHKMAVIIGKAKKLRREGFPTDGFKEIKVADGVALNAGQLPPCSGIELCMEGGKLIRFQAVDQLIDFLKKAA
jgi:hypothetical protein